MLCGIDANHESKEVEFGGGVMASRLDVDESYVLEESEMSTSV